MIAAFKAGFQSDFMNVPGNVPGYKFWNAVSYGLGIGFNNAGNEIMKSYKPESRSWNVDWKDVGLAGGLGALGGFGSKYLGDLIENTKTVKIFGENVDVLESDFVRSLTKIGTVSMINMFSNPDYYRGKGKYIYPEEFINNTIIECLKFKK